MGAKGGGNEKNGTMIDNSPNQNSKHKTKTDQELERTEREKYPFSAIKSMFCISGGYPKLNPFQLSV